MKHIWQRIEKWLEEHAPTVRQRLPQGATDHEFAVAEDELGFSLPDDFKASYSIHNGSGDAPLMAAGPLFSVDQMLDEWADWYAMYGSFDATAAQLQVRYDVPDQIKPTVWNNRWLPFCGMFGSSHCLDLDPTESGTHGQIISYSLNVGPITLIATSLGDYLEAFAEQLEAGHYMVTDGALTYATLNETRVTPPSRPTGAGGRLHNDPLDDVLNEIQPRLGRAQLRRCGHCRTSVQDATTRCPQCGSPVL